MTEPWITAAALIKLGVARDTLLQQMSSGKWRSRSDGGTVKIAVDSLPGALQKKVYRAFEAAAKTDEESKAAARGAASELAGCPSFAAWASLDLLPVELRERVVCDFRALIDGRLNLLQTWRTMASSQRRTWAGRAARLWVGLAQPLVYLYPQLGHLPFPTVLDRACERAAKATQPPELVTAVLDLPLHLNPDAVHRLNKEAGLLV